MDGPVRGHFTKRVKSILGLSFNLSLSANQCVTFQTKDVLICREIELDFANKCIVNLFNAQHMYTCDFFFRKKCLFLWDFVTAERIFD